jgi:hypothetical protein
MLRRLVVPVVGIAALSLIGAAPASSARIVKWPPWLSIESPVNPWDPASRGVAFYVRALRRDGFPEVAELTGTAEGLVGGARRSLPLEFVVTSRPGVFSVRRSWPADGAWVVRVSLQSTTALVTLDRDGNVASTRIPTERTAGGLIPRDVSQREVDSTLTELAKR